MATIQEIQEHLISKAKERSVVTYGDLCRKFGLPAPTQGLIGHPLSDILDVIDREDVNLNRPFLTAVVINATKQMPGNGFFGALQDYAEIAVPNNEDQKLTFWLKYLNELYDYWS